MEAQALTTGNKIETTKPSGLPAYVVYTNKNGVQFKVINFDNPDVCPNKGIVEYRAIKERNFEFKLESNFTCPVVKDPITEIYYGIFNGFHNNGDPKWINFPLGMINMYDRSIPTEAKKALIMSKSYITEGCTFINKQMAKKLAKFRLYDKEVAATKLIERINNSERALQHARGLNGQKLYDMALNLGIDTTHSSLTMVTAEVLEKAQSDPSGYLKIVDNPNIEIISILNKALDTRVVEQDSHKGYTYKGATLGHNFDFAIDFLLKNKEVLAVIDMASRDAIEQGRKASVSEKTVDPHDEIARLKKELAEAQAKNAEIESNKTDGEGVPYSPLQEELAGLLVVAKEKKLRGLHMYKATPESISKLKQAIADKK